MIKIQRFNLLNYKEEFKPPNIRVGGGIFAQLLFNMRKFLDLQLWSIWRDLKLILPNISGNVLDVGCGAQPYRLLFNSNNIHYVGIDYVGAKPNFNYENNDTLYYSGHKFPVEDDTFDFVMCTEVLEHVLNPEIFVSEIFRVLRAEGTLLCTIPFSARWHFIPFDYYRYTPSAINHLLSQAGFIEIQVYARGNEFTVACYKVNSLMLAFLFTNKKLVTFKGVLYRLIGILCVPMIIVGSIVANISMYTTNMAADCLGFTILAKK